MEHLPLVGRYKFEIQRKGDVVLAQAGKNLVVTAGKARAANVLFGALTPLGAYLAFGNNSNPPDLLQTALIGTEPFARTLLTGSVLSNFFTQTGTITNAGSPTTIREMGILSAAAAGTLISRWIPNEFTFATGDSMVFNWTLEVG